MLEDTPMNDRSNDSAIHAQQARERRYQAYIEDANDLIFSLDAAGKITSVNRTFCEVSGYTAEELVGQDPLMLVAPESLAATTQALRTILSGESIQQYELEVITKDGQRRLMEVRGRLIVADGKVVETFQIARDITERKRSREEIQRRALEQETLRKAVLALTTSLDPDEVVDCILSQLQAVVPYDTASVQLLTKNTLEIVGGRGFDDIESVLGITFDVDCEDYPNYQVVHKREPVIIPHVYAAYDQFQSMSHTDVLTRSWLGVPMLVGENLIGMIALDKYELDYYTQAHARLAEAFAAQAAIAMENSRLFEAERAQRERAEALQAELEQRVAARTEELQAQYARLDAILESTADGIVVTDHLGAITQANSIVKTWLSDTLEPEDRQKLIGSVEELARQTAAARPDAKATTILELTGIDLELNAARVKSQDAVQTATVVVNIHDVSHLKTIERMKTRFLSNVSHELRTPVTAISLYVHLMQEQPNRCTEYLPSLAKVAQQQASLIQDIVLLSRLDAGRIILRREVVRLNDIVESTLERRRTSLDQRQDVVTYTPSPRDITVNVDKDYVSRALDFLLEAAVAPPPRQSTLTVTTAPCAAGAHPWATISITSAGSAIPEEELPHIFDRFFRSEYLQIQASSNSGLGLSIAQAIIELQDGRIAVESQASHGTTFTIWLPVASSAPG